MPAPQNMFTFKCWKSLEKQVYWVGLFCLSSPVLGWIILIITLMALKIKTARRFGKHISGQVRENISRED